MAPFWKRGPPLEKVIAREGGNTRLDCNIRGFPKPSFSWNRNGRPLPLDKHKKVCLCSVDKYTLTILFPYMEQACGLILELILDSDCFRAISHHVLGTELDS